MKLLNYYINLLPKQDGNKLFSPPMGYGIYDYIYEVYDFYCGDIPEDICEYIKHEKYCDYLYRNIHGRSNTKLKEIIEHEYPDMQLLFNELSDTEIKIIGKPISIYGEFENLVWYYGYTALYGDNCIILKQYDIIDKRNFFRRDAHAICYCVMKNKEVSNILINGISNKEPIISKYPRKIQLYCTNKNIKKDINFKKYFDKITNNSDISDYTCLRINLNLDYHLSINVFKDTSLVNENAIWTYNKIPADIIKETNYLDYFK